MPHPYDRGPRRPDGCYQRDVDAATQLTVMTTICLVALLVLWLIN